MALIVVVLAAGEAPLERPLPHQPLEPLHQQISRPAHHRHPAGRRRGSGGGEVGRSATVVCRFDCVRVKKADDSRGSRRGDRSSSSNPDRRRPHPSRVWVAGRMAGTGCSDVRHRDVLVTDTWAHVSSAQMYSLVWRVFVMGFDSCTNPELFIF